MAASLSTGLATTVLLHRKSQTSTRYRSNYISCVAWDPEGLFKGPAKTGHIARMEFQRRLEKDADAREAFERQVREEKERRKALRESREIPDSAEDLVEYFLDTEAREIEFEIARMRGRLNEEFFSHLKFELGQLRFAVSKTEATEERLIELEALQKALMEGIEAYDKMQSELITAKKSLTKILTSKDVKSTLLDMVESNELNRSLLALLDENIASAQIGNQKEAAAFMEKVRGAVLNRRVQCLNMATAEISEQAEAGGPGSDHRNSSKTTRISWRICRSPDPSTIHGFDKELMLVGNLFQRNEDDVRFKAIGIVGVQGIGKSTLCRKLLEAPEFKTDYLPRIWVSVSRECTDGQDRKAALVKRILLCLGFEEEKLESIPGNGNLEDLLYVLHLQLTGKRYLIVLDDVNESEDWLTNLNCPPPNRSESHLADGLPKNGGGRVIVTSRSSAVAKAIVGEKNVHQLLPFSDPENFSKIYEQEVKTLWSESDLEYFNDPEVKQALLDKCRGLPFYAKMLAEEKKLRDEEQKLKDEEKKKLHKR